MIFSRNAIEMALAHLAHPPNSLGVKDANDSMDGGVVESYMSADSMPTWLLYYMSSLIDFINPFSL